MSEFTYIFRGRGTFPSPEETQKHLQKWVAWFKDLNAKGVIKDPGHPLDGKGKVVRGSHKTIHDGPYAEAKDVVAGYIVVAARDLPHATDLATGCPILEVGGSVEVREIQKMEM